MRWHLQALPALCSGTAMALALAPVQRTCARPVRDGLILRVPCTPESAPCLGLHRRQRVLLAKDVQVVVYEAQLVQVVKHDDVLALVVRDAAGLKLVVAQKIMKDTCMCTNALGGRAQLCIQSKAEHSSTTAVHFVIRSVWLPR